MAEPTLDWRVRVPEHVVYRDFPGETVILNLQSGQYHGLNRTAARMLDLLRESASVREAVVALAGEYGQPERVVERDVMILCGTLSARGLIVDDRAA